MYTVSQQKLPYWHLHVSNVLVCAQVKVRVRGSSQQYSDWSKVFSLDAAGSEGIFQCLDKKSKQDYQVINF